MMYLKGVLSNQAVHNTLGGVFYLFQDVVIRGKDVLFLGWFVIELIKFDSRSRTTALA